MHAHEAISVKGMFRVLSVPEDRIHTPEEVARGIRDGKIRVDYEHHNLIVNQGLQAIAKILGGGAGAPEVGGVGVFNITDLVVNRMELGNSPSPPAPVVTDIVSVVNLVYVPQLLINYAGPYTVRFSGVVRHAELNGTTFTEEALKMTNGLVFAKVNGFSVLKQVTAAKQFDHEIVFSRV